MKYGVYFHIPFCFKKCNYCDFLSFNSFDVSLTDKEAYFDALMQEWVIRSASILPKDKIDSIYIGGGTPSLVDYHYIQDIVNIVKNTKNVTDDAEITIEVNPGTVTLEKLKAYYSVGINRLSIGVQSTQNRLLKSLGRIHNVNDCEDAMKLAKEAGFSNINCDLIFGIPQVEDELAQTLEEFRQDVKRVLEWGATHVSAYSLIVEEDTPLCKLFEQNKAFEINSEIERQMYYEMPNLINDYNLQRYEISNYGRYDTQSRHNLKYWQCLPYIGFGLGAASYYPQNKKIKDTNYIRETNTKNLNDYINLYFNDESEEISIKEQMQEFMMLGFRCVKGPDYRAFRKRFGCKYVDVFKNELERLAAKGLIKYRMGAKLTEKGYDFANEVFREFV